MKATIWSASRCFTPRADPVCQSPDSVLSGQLGRRRFMEAGVECHTSENAGRPFAMRWRGSRGTKYRSAQGCQEDLGSGRRSRRGMIMEDMATEVKPQPHLYKGRPISVLG